MELCLHAIKFQIDWHILVALICPPPPLAISMASPPVFRFSLDWVADYRRYFNFSHAVSLARSSGRPQESHSQQRPQKIGSNDRCRCCCSCGCCCYGGVIGSFIGFVLLPCKKCDVIRLKWYCARKSIAKSLMDYSQDRMFKKCTIESYTCTHSDTKWWILWMYFIEKSLSITTQTLMVYHKLSRKNSEQRASLKSIGSNGGIKAAEAARQKRRQ